MKTASFFILSLSLHAAALVYPVSFYVPNRGQLIQVTILPMEQEDGRTDDQGSGGHRAAQVRSQFVSRPTSNIHPTVEREPTDDSRPQTLPAEAVTIVSDSSVTLVSAPANSSATSSTVLSDSTSQSDSDSGAGMGGAGGNGVGSSGAAGSGRGNGNGSGAGAAGGGIALTQARYRDTPKPIYPETARREGREGRVVLRVLIDNQGNTKSVELNASSGSQALDQAATEAIKQWRFHPAHVGHTPIDSWVNVPIDFRLTDARN